MGKFKDTLSDIGTGMFDIYGMPISTLTGKRISEMTGYDWNTKFGQNTIDPFTNIMASAHQMAAPIAANALMPGVGGMALGTAQGIVQGAMGNAGEGVAMQQTPQIDPMMAMYGMQGGTQGSASMFCGGGNMRRRKLGEGGDMLTEYNGLPHELGGLPLGQTGNEVEGGETSINDYVFSDRIMYDPQKKTTFADQSKKIRNKYKRREGDRYSDESMAMELEALRGEQEKFKSSMSGNPAGINPMEQMQFPFGGALSNMATAGTASGSSLLGDPIQKALFDNRNVPFVQRMRDPNSPKIYNKDGSHSTHKMEWSEGDGKYYAYPTLFPDGKGGLKTVSNPYKYARDNGEYIEFDNKDVARTFAAGAWKNDFEKTDLKNTSGSSAGTTDSGYSQASFKYPYGGEIPPTGISPYYNPNVWDVMNAMNFASGSVSPIPISQFTPDNKGQFKNIHNLSNKQYNTIADNNGFGVYGFNTPVDYSGNTSVGIKQNFPEQDIPANPFTQYMPTDKNTPIGSPDITFPANDFSGTIAPYMANQNLPMSGAGRGVSPNDYISSQNKNILEFQTPEATTTPGNTNQMGQYMPKELGMLPGYVASNAGNIYDIMYGAKGGDDVNFDRVNLDPDLVDYSPARRDILKQGAEAKAIGRSNLQGIGNAGQYMGNLGVMAADVAGNVGSGLANVTMQEGNTNAQIKNQAKQTAAVANAQIQMQEAIARQQEKDLAASAVSSGLHGIGTTTSAYTSDIRKDKVQQDIVKNWLKTANYTWTPYGAGYEKVENGETVTYVESTGKWYKKDSKGKYTEFNKLK